jgi:hypothetical protein
MFQSVGGTLVVAGILGLGSAALRFIENGTWTATTLAEGLNDRHWFYPETGRWASETLPSLIANIPFGLVLLTIGLAAVIVGSAVMLELPSAQPAAPRPTRDRGI